MNSYKSFQAKPTDFKNSSPRKKLFVGNLWNPHVHHTLLQPKHEMNFLCSSHFSSLPEDLTYKPKPLYFPCNGGSLPTKNNVKDQPPMPQAAFCSPTGQRRVSSGAFHPTKFDLPQALCPDFVSLSPQKKKPQSFRDNPLKKAKVKTELCENMRKTGKCEYGTKCSYAHGKHELQLTKLYERENLEDISTFRSRPCPDWVSTGSW